MKLWLGENKPSEEWVGCTKMEGLAFLLLIDNNIEVVSVGSDFCKNDIERVSALCMIEKATVNENMDVEYH